MSGPSAKISRLRLSPLSEARLAAMGKLFYSLASLSASLDRLATVIMRLQCRSDEAWEEANFPLGPNSFAKTLELRDQRRAEMFVLLLLHCSAS